MRLQVERGLRVEIDLGEGQSVTISTLRKPRVVIVMGRRWKVRRTRTYGPATLDAVATLGTLIASARRERRMTVSELCERAGITPNTVRAIETGAPTVAIGVVFEVAMLLGVPLFAPSPSELGALRERARERFALLPASVRRNRDVDDDF